MSQLFSEHATATSTSVVGLEITLPQSCRCGEAIAVAGSSSGPHYASIQCTRCGVHRGWIGAAAFNFLSSTIENFGGPNAPVEIRRNQSSPAGADTLK